MSAEASIRRALRLLEAASADNRHCGPSDGSEPLHWPLAVRAARIHLAHALACLDIADVPLCSCGHDGRPGPGHQSNCRQYRERAEPRIATPDDVRGMAWFNGLTEAGRREWLQRAGSDVPADAWAAYEAAREVRARKPA